MRKCKTFKKLPMKTQSVEMMIYHWQGSVWMEESAWLVFKNITNPFPLLYLLSKVSGIPHLWYSYFDSIGVDLHFLFTFSWILKTGRADVKRMMKMWRPLSGWTKSYIDYLASGKGFRCCAAFGMLHREYWRFLMPSKVSFHTQGLDKSPPVFRRNLINDMREAFQSWRQLSNAEMHVPEVLELFITKAHCAIKKKVQALGYRAISLWESWCFFIESVAEVIARTCSGVCMWSICHIILKKFVPEKSEEKNISSYKAIFTLYRHLHDIY